MRIDELRVTVVGAGTGGAATALLLAREGARVTVLERVSEMRAVGAGIAIADNGMAVLESLGLGPALARVPRAESPRIVDARGRTLFTPPRGISLRLLRRSTLQGTLLDALHREQKIEMQLGVEVTAVTREGRVHLRADAGESSHEADLVVGADGVHSVVRGAGAFGGRERAGITYLRALVPTGMATGVEAWTSAGIFAAFDVDDGTYFYASAGASACAAAVEARNLDRLRKAWGAAYAPAARVLAAVDRFDDFLINRVIRVDCRRWHDGRLVLLGDAAHAMAPNLGQGANSAMVDAAVLLDELRRAPDLAAALAAYDARRRPAVRAVADVASRLGAAAELTSPVARWIRDRALMPIAQRLSSERDTDRLLQEKPNTLRAIGHR